MKHGTFKSAMRADIGEGSCIICGTDFSDEAQLAVRAAAAIARPLQEPVLLVHVVETPSLGVHADVMRLLADSRREPLDREANKIRRNDVVVVEGSPAGRADEVLVKLGSEGPTRLIVVGSLGQRGVADWLLGSVAERTAERARVPTLVVRKARPFEAWARGERPLKVFVAFNFTDTSTAALRWIKELQAIGPCEVVVGFVELLRQKEAREAGSEPGKPDGNRAELEQELQARVTEVLGSAPFRLLVETCRKKPYIHLADMAKNEGADLIVVGSHQYHGFELLWHASVSRGLLHRAETSVVVVPRSAVSGGDGHES